MEVHVATVNYNSGKFTELLLKSLISLNPRINFSFSIFDNGSRDGSLNFLKSVHNVEFRVVSERNPYPTGSNNHAFGLDQLISTFDQGCANYYMTVDTDCFSLSHGWVESRVTNLLEGCQLVGATAYCPTVENGFSYIWPGFSIMTLDVVRSIRENRLSYAARRDVGIVKDTGQVISDFLKSSGFQLKFLPRTPPKSIGSVALEKWSIDEDIHHFFAASKPATFLQNFRYVHNDRARGRYIQKRIEAWRFFRQHDIREILAASI